MAGVTEQDPLGAVAWPVRTERLLLRRVEERDAAATFAIRSQEAVGRWITRRETDPVEWAERLADPDRARTSLVVERDGVVIGDVMVSIEDAWAQAEVAHLARGVQAELGWVLDPAHGGHGYATEAVSTVLRVCFEDVGLRRVTASCFAANEASWQLMERVGMRREQHTVRDSLHRDGRWLDGYTYALLADEWRARIG